MGGTRGVRRSAIGGALATALACAILLVAGESTSAPPSPLQRDGSDEAAPTTRVTSCVVEVKGVVKGRGPCTIEYFTERLTLPLADGGFFAERTVVRIVGRAPALLVDLAFFDEPQLGAQAGTLDSGLRRMSYGSVAIEQDGRKWAALAHAERDFRLTLSSVKPTCNDGGLKCWEVHGQLQTTVPSALLSPYETPLQLSATF